MEQAKVPGGVVYDRRHWTRAVIEIPVEVSREKTGRGAAFSAVTAQASNISAGGVYLAISEEPSVRVGEILRVSITIPAELRRMFPFSLIEGPSRVVRVETVSVPEERLQGLALAFCEGMTRLGAIVFA